MNNSSQSDRQLQVKEIEAGEAKEAKVEESSQAKIEILQAEITISQHEEHKGAARRFALPTLLHRAEPGDAALHVRRGSEV